MLTLFVVTAQTWQEVRFRDAGTFQWARLDSNQGPTDYESAALTS